MDIPSKVQHNVYGRHRVIDVGDFRAMESEKDFTQVVLDTAKLLGWVGYHTWQSIHSAPGFPDLVLTREGWLIIAEIKSEKGQLTKAQSKWISLLRLVEAINFTLKVYVWKPSDWDTLVSVLKGEFHK